MAITLNDLRQDWITMADDLRSRLDGLEAGSLMHEAGQDSHKLTERWKAILRKWQSEVEELQHQYGVE